MVKDEHECVFCLPVLNQILLVYSKGTGDFNVTEVAFLLPQTAVQIHFFLNIHYSLGLKGAFNPNYSLPMGRHTRGKTTSALFSLNDHMITLTTTIPIRISTQKIKAASCLLITFGTGNEMNPTSYCP